MIFDFEIVDVSIVAPAVGTSSKKGLRFSQECRHLIVKAPNATVKYRILMEYDDGIPFRRIPDTGDLTGNTIKDLDALIIGVFNIYIVTDTAGTFQLRFVGEKARV